MWARICAVLSATNTSGSAVTRPGKFVRRKHGTVGFLDASSRPLNRQSGVALTLAPAVQNVACAVGISTSLGGLEPGGMEPKAALVTLACLGLAWVRPSAAAMRRNA